MAGSCSEENCKKHQSSFCQLPMGVFPRSRDDLDTVMLNASGLQVETGRCQDEILVKQNAHCRTFDTFSIVRTWHVKCCEYLMVMVSINPNNSVFSLMFPHSEANTFHGLTLATQTYEKMTALCAQCRCPCLLWFVVPHQHLLRSAS